MKALGELDKACAILEIVFTFKVAYFDHLDQYPFKSTQKILSLWQLLQECHRNFLITGEYVDKTLIRLSYALCCTILICIEIKLS